MAAWCGQRGEGKQQPWGQLQDGPWIHLRIQVLYGTERAMLLPIVSPVGGGYTQRQELMVPVSIRFAG